MIMKHQAAFLLVVVSLCKAYPPSKQWPDGIPLAWANETLGQKRVINGFPTDYLSWRGAIFLPGSGCTGAYIHPRVVMTANHCCERLPLDVMGGPDRQNLVLYGTSTAHELAPGNDITNDMCLLLIGTEKPASIPHYDVAIVNSMPRDDVIIAGYGDNQPGRGYGVHRYGLLEFYRLATNTNDIIVGARAGTNPQQQPCDGDSGAPLFVKNSFAGWVVHAVNSRGPRRCDPGGDDFCANVVGNLEWIRNITSGWGVPVTPGICSDCTYDESFDEKQWANN